MLVELSITNFRSIKSTQTLSMLPSKRVKTADRPNDLIAVPNYPKLYLLRSAILYGANNAGKSNILKVFYALKWLVEKSTTLNVGDSIDANEYFLFDQQTLEQPSSFVVNFIAEDGLRYEYSLTVNQKTVLFESLYYYPLGRDKETKMKLYVREAGNIDFNKEESGLKKTLAKNLGNNQLFLSKAGNNNPERLKAAYTFFSQYISTHVFGTQFEEKELRKAIASMMANNRECQDYVANLLTKADTGIINLQVEENSIGQFAFPDNFSDELKKKIVESVKFAIKTTHRMFDGNKEIESKQSSLDLESEGTRKLFAIGGFMYDALQKGSLLVIDELDNSLHSDLTRLVLKQINFVDSNPNNTQLILSTHDGTLLNLFSKDQIYLIEKDYYGQTTVSAISEFEGLRKNSPIEEWYRAGRLGGVPHINNDLSLLNNG